MKLVPGIVVSSAALPFPFVALVDVVLDGCMPDTVVQPEIYE